MRAEGICRTRGCRCSRSAGSMSSLTGHVSRVSWSKTILCIRICCTGCSWEQEHQLEVVLLDLDHLGPLEPWIAPWQTPQDLERLGCLVFSQHASHSPRGKPPLSRRCLPRHSKQHQSTNWSS